MCIFVILALRGWRQEAQDFKVIFAFIANLGKPDTHEMGAGLGGKKGGQRKIMYAFVYV